ncbi:hypothetical protein DB30_00084 [Enhygromyxa salina]|uniref:Uncharacterized protein n=1 Tax=Enhygromyxa salina TaxID=215803 RepID=A0A0C2DDP9_9BACT|nr:hypothetical protein [Enhygromyxa salina]KIG19575.1 hypothetical protein DB30_00084 [Enhygromyxa salina]
MSEPQTESKALAKLAGGQPWRGDEHELRLEAAREAGLETEDVNEVEVGLFTDGFKAGMTLDDPADRSIVLRGRTVLREAQMSKALHPTLRFLAIPADQVALRVTDGEFELRVSENAAEAAKPALDSARLVLRLWIGLGLVGMLAWYWFNLGWLAAILWGGALVGGGYVLRQGAVSGRALLGARLTVALAMLAQQEKLILPPSRARVSPES